MDIFRKVCGNMRFKNPIMAMEELAIYAIMEFKRGNQKTDWSNPKLLLVNLGLLVRHSYCSIVEQLSVLYVVIIFSDYTR